MEPYHKATSITLSGAPESHPRGENRYTYFIHMTVGGDGSFPLGGTDVYVLLLHMMVVGGGVIPSHSAGQILALVESRMSLDAGNNPIAHWPPRVLEKGSTWKFQLILLLPLLSLTRGWEACSCCVCLWCRWPCSRRCIIFDQLSHIAIDQKV